MNPFRKLQLYLQRKYIRKVKDRSIDRAFVNLNDARRVGILYDATNPRAGKEARAFAESLRKAGKQVRSLAYHPSIKKQETEPDYPYFTSKNVNWKLVPAGAEVERFQQSEFDILFCLFLEENPALECLTALSRAKTRVGPVHGHLEYYDLLIDLGPEKSIRGLIEEAERLLKKMNAKHEESITVPV